MTLTLNNIITVTQGGILYRDEQDQIKWIDFAHCNRNWTRARRNLNEWDFHCVGMRKADPLCVEFCLDPPVQFVVERTEEVDRDFALPLKVHGNWTLCDAS